jgi:hypothetical protein
MQVNSAIKSQYTAQAAKPQATQSTEVELKDTFQSSSETSGLCGAELALGIMTAALATPVAIGAAAGAAGVGAVALGTAALCAIAPPDDSEYPTSDTGFQSIALSAGLAAVGALGGTAAVATVGALGLAAGVALWATANN